MNPIYILWALPAARDIEPLRGDAVLDDGLLVQGRGREDHSHREEGGRITLEHISRE